MTIGTVARRPLSSPTPVGYMPTSACPCTVAGATSRASSESRPATRRTNVPLRPYLVRGHHGTLDAQLRRQVRERLGGRQLFHLECQRAGPIGLLHREGGAVKRQIGKTGRARAGEPDLTGGRAVGIRHAQAVADRDFGLVLELRRVEVQAARVAADF